MAKQKKPSVQLGATEDLSTMSIIVRSDGANITTEEVIPYLESTGLAPRTRQHVQYIIQKGEALLICFNVALDWCFKVDVLAALKNFFESKEYACVLV